MSWACQALRPSGLHCGHSLLPRPDPRWALDGQRRQSVSREGHPRLVSPEQDSQGSRGWSPRVSPCGKRPDPSVRLASLRGGGSLCCPGSCHYLLTLRRGVLANQELLAGNGAVLGRTGSVRGNLLLPWCVTAWGTGRLGTDLGSPRSWCPEAGGAFRLGLAGPCPFLGAVGRLPWGSRLRAGCYLCPDGGSACCGDSQRAASQRELPLWWQGLQERARELRQQGCGMASAFCS